jgi:NitT/TauT family transport system permease protein
MATISPGSPVAASTAADDLPPSGSALVRADVLRPIVLPIATALVVLVAWQFCCDYYKIPPLALPAPTVIYHTLVRNFPLLMEHAAQTAYEVALGFVLSIVLGAILGMGIAYSRLFRESVYPNLVFFQLIPKVALAPLFIMWFGLGSQSRLAFAVFMSFFPMVLSTASGLSNVDPNAIRLCEALTATRLQTFIAVRFPFALPNIFNGMKIAVTMSMIGVVVGEFITSQAGLGYLILFAASRAESPIIFAAIAVLCTIGLLFFGIVVLGEKIVLRWYGTPTR